MSCGACHLATWFPNFIGAAGYDLNALRPDLAPFTFLLGNDDSTQLFSPDTAMNSVS